MKSKMREKTIFEKKLLRATMFSMAIFVAILFIGSAVAASLAGSNATIENNYEKQLGDPTARAGVMQPVLIAASPQPLLLSGDIFYAYNAYDPTNVVDEGPIYFESDDPGTVTLLAPTTSPNFIAGGCWVEDEGWYGCQYLGGLWHISEIDGSMTLIAPLAQSFNGLTYCDLTDTMYGATSTDLYTVDRETGATSHVGSFGIGFSMIGIACDGQGNMYGTTVDFSAIANLYSIDMTTGSATSIGSTGLPLLYAQDMEYDKENDILYLAAYTSASGGQLYTCDTDTGATTLIGNFQGGMEVTGFAIEYVTTPPQNDLALQSIIRPASGTGSVITPQVRIRNRGLTDAFNVPVDMNIGKWEYTTYFEEDFTGVAVGAIPTGWTKIPETTHWGVVNTALAGGVAPEMRFYWSPSATDKFQLQTPMIDTTGLTEVTFSFRHYLSHYSGPYTLQVVAIADGDSYIIEEWVNPTASIPAQLKEYTLTADDHGLGTDEFQIVFIFDGYTWNTNNWNIDDVMLYQKEFIPEYEETIYINILADETLEFDFPAWTPDDLGVAENVDIIYYCEAEIDYVDENPGNNYRDKTFTLNFGYLYDIGVIDIPSPVSGVGGTQIPVATVENFGQFDVTSANVNMHIQENIAGGESLINQWVNPTGWGAQLMTYTLTDVEHGVGAENFQIAWVFDGNSYNTNNWNIDNIKVTGDGVTLYEEDFTGTPADELPPGWTKTPETTNWNVANTALAGGTSPELRFNWLPSSVNRFYVITPYFDTSGYDEIELEFRHFLSHFSGAYTLEVVAIATEYMTVYDETVGFDIAAGDVMDITFPAWTPAAPFADVEYLVTACTSIEMLSALFNEEFTGVPIGEIPDGWTKDPDTANWGVSNTNYAGGVAPEMQFYWMPNILGIYYLKSPMLDTTDMTTLDFSFKHYLAHYDGDYTLKVVSLADGFEYVIEEWVNPIGFPAELQEYTLTAAHGVGADDFQIAFIFDGQPWNLDWWCIDDIVIADPDGETIEDGNPANDCMSKMIILEYLHDVGTTQIIPFPGGRDRDVILKYHGGYSDNAVGLNSPGLWEGAIRLTPTELGPFDTWHVTEVYWYHHEAGSQSGQLKIYEGGTAQAPGAMIYTKPFTVTGAGLKTIDVDDPLSIDATEDLWVSIEVDQLTAPLYPIGVDDGPAVAGKGDMVYLGGTWGTLSGYDLDFNWVIEVKVEAGGPAGNIYEPGTYTPQAIIENFGTYTEVNFNVNAQIIDGDGEVFWEDDVLVDTPMNPGDTQLITFVDVTFDEIAAHEGEYTLVVETQLPEDENPHNDMRTWNFIIDIYDDIPPETTHELTGVMGDNNWYVSDVTITLTAIDPWPYIAPVGVNNTWISFDGETFELYVGPVVVTEDGVTQFWYYSDDYNGNVEDVNGPFEFQRDATPPTINLAVEGSGTTWTLIATVDDATSGVARVEFYVNDEYLGEVTSAPFEWEYTNAKKGDIAQAIVYDNAGNSKISNAVEPTVLVSQHSTPVWQVLQKTIN